MPDTQTPNVTPAIDASVEVDARLAAAQNEITDLKSSLAESRRTIDAVERSRVIERELAAAGALDTEVASLLTEMTVRGMKEPDVALAVRDLKKRKPFLFKRDAAGVGPSAMSAAIGARVEAASTAADEARATGDRRALLRYLRERREREV